MKLIKIYLSDVFEEINVNGLFNVATGDFGEPDLDRVLAAWQEYSSNLVDALLAVDADVDTLFDYKIFDPCLHLKNADGSRFHVNADGWTGWLNNYHDPEGHSIDTIFDKFDDEIQSY